MLRTMGRLRTFSGTRKNVLIVGAILVAAAGVGVWAWLVVSASGLTVRLPAAPMSPGLLVLSVQSAPTHFDGSGGVTPAEGGLWEVDTRRGTIRLVARGLGVDARVSPDGRSVAYCDDLDRMWIRPMDGGSGRQVPGVLGLPVWSPDSATIAVSRRGRTRPGAAPIAEVGNVRIAVNHLHVEPLPIVASEQIWDWSPDGKWLLVVAKEAGNKTSIGLRSPDGRNSRDLTDGSALDLSPRFSPDGRHVAFCRYEGREPAVYLINADGTGMRRLLRGLTDNVAPSWSPDGASLLLRFHHTLEVVDLDGRRRDPIGLRVKKPFDVFDPSASFDPDPLYLGGAEWIPLPGSGPGR